MPTYEYKCEKCNHRFDVFHKMSESPQLTCSQCGGEVRRMPSVGNVSSSGGSVAQPSCAPGGL